MYSKETLDNSAQVLATLFRSSLLQERTKEMISGMMYIPSQEKILGNFHELFDFEGQTVFGGDDIKELEGWLSGVFGEMEKFIEENNLMFQIDGKKPSGLQKGLVQELKPIEASLIEKVRKMLLSTDFGTNFNNLQEKSTYRPKEKLREWASY